ncbi:unnamed protein product [Calypogeia fissa]
MALLCGRKLANRFKNQSVLWTAPDVAGWLEKRGGPFAAWKLRFFILQSSSLFYFKDNLDIENAQPLGVIPMEGTILEVAELATAGATTQRKWCITVMLGPQFGGKRDTHVLSAPSKQALEEWLDKFTTAGKTHVNLLAQLYKSRRRGSELRATFSKTPGYPRMLSNAQGEEVEELQKALGKVKEEIVKVHDKALAAKAQADEYEGAAMRALTLWSILSPRFKGSDTDNAYKILERLHVELESTTELCKLLEMKAGFFQGQGLDKLSEDGRTALYLMCEKALDSILDHQARIRVHAPRYTSDVNPLIFPEHDSQFKHTSAIYDLCLKLKKSAKKVTVDLDDNMATRINKTTTAAAARNLVSSKLKNFKYDVLKAGLTAALVAAKARVGKTYPGASSTGPNAGPPETVVDNTEDSTDSDKSESSTVHSIRPPEAIAENEDDSTDSDDED